MPLLARLVVLATLALGATAWAGDLELQTADGVTLRATSYGSTGQGVVLVHEVNRSRADWAGFAGKLARSGFQVVAVDLRGHGESSGEADGEDLSGLVADVQAAVGWLQEAGVERVAVVGGGLGANLALNVAADEAVVDNAVLLSPRPNIRGVKVLRAIEAYQGALLIVAAADSTLGTRTATALEERAQGPHHVEMVATGEGVRILTRNADAETVVLTWLRGVYQVEGDDPLDSRKEVTTGDLSEIETTGVKYGEDKL